MVFQNNGKSEQSISLLPRIKYLKYHSVARYLTIGFAISVLIVATAIAIVLSVYYFAKEKANLRAEADTYLADLVIRLKSPIWNAENDEIESIGKRYAQKEIIGNLKIYDVYGSILFEKTNEKDESLLLYRHGDIEHEGLVLGKVELALTSRLYREKYVPLIVTSIVTIFIVTVVLTLMTGFLLNRFLEKPVLQFEKIVAAYANGEYELQDMRADKPIREFVPFLKALEKMRDKIHEQMVDLARHQEHLEELVDARTSDLSAANKYLSIATEENKQRAFEMSVLNEMSFNLNRYKTERDTYVEMAKTSEKLFPNDSGYMYILNNAGTKLERVAKWGDAPDGPEFLEIDGCTCFLSGKEIFCEESVGNSHCRNKASIGCHRHSCIPIFIRGEKIGVFHICFKPSDDIPDDEWLEQIESRRALFVRMTEQYAPFLGNLRLRIIDPLTGLRNRIYMNESLEHEMRGVEQIGIIYFDIDNFREINNKHGNEAGDRFLSKIGALLKEQTRLNDIPCRYGGGEFIVILPGVQLVEVGEQAEKLREKIKNELKVEYEGIFLDSTASFGVTAFPDHAANISTLISVAEKALRRAKAGGRDRVVVI